MRKRKKKGHRFAENRHLRENSCLVKGHSPTVPRPFSPFPASQLQDPPLPSLSHPHPFDSKVTYFAFFSHTHCSHSLCAAPRGFLAEADHLVIPCRKKMQWVDKCTALWFVKLPCEWIYMGLLRCLFFPECSVAITVTHMWTPPPPQHARTHTHIHTHTHTSTSKH